MNTISGGTFIRTKPKLEKVFEMETPVVLCNPRGDMDGGMYVCSHAGEILKFTDDGEVSTFMTIGGMPNNLAFINNDVYFADISNGVIYEKKSTQNDISLLLKTYEGSPLKGPSSLVLNKTRHYLIISDSGYFGSTSMNEAKGSVYHYDLNTNIVYPLMLNCLAHPSDIVLDEHAGILYIAETFKNRIIRVTQHPEGIFHSSVFYTFNGRIGPTALAIDELGNIYVGRFEFQNKEKTNDGLITILNKEGVEIGELLISGMSEINGMYIPNNKTKENVLYFTDKNFSGVMKIKLSQLSNENNDKNQI